MKIEKKKIFNYLDIGKYFLIVIKMFSVIVNCFYLLIIGINFLKKDEYVI